MYPTNRPLSRVKNIEVIVVIEEQSKCFFSLYLKESTSPHHMEDVFLSIEWTICCSEANLPPLQWKKKPLLLCYLGRLAPPSVPPIFLTFALKTTTLKLFVMEC
jgi:hypothetical protein